MKTKLCRKCGIEKSLDDFERKGLFGKRSSCKPCHRKEVQEWRDKNRDHVRELDRKYYAQDPEKQRAEALDAYYKDPERAKQRNKEWYAKHSEYKKDWIDEHREQENSRLREWAKQNPEKRKSWLRRWKDANPSKSHEYTIKRRAYEANGRFTADEWNLLLAKYGKKCLACGANDIKLVPDHVIPLSRGGTNTIDNIQPLCEKCNAKKHTKSTDYRPH